MPKKSADSQPREPAPKTTAAEMEQRISEVHGLLVKRKTRGYILNHAATKWQIAERQTDELIARATERIKESAAYDRDLELALALETLRSVIGKAAETMDFQRVIAAQRELSLMLGLHAPTKTELKIDGLDARMLERLAAAASAAGKDVAGLLTMLTRQLEEMNKK